MREERKTRIFNSTPYRLYRPRIVKARGCRIVDEDGKEYLDFESGVWCANLGHNDEDVNSSLKEAMDTVTHVGYGYSHAVVEETAEVFLETLGMPDGRCIFLSSGSEAVEFALQAARKMMPQSCFLGLEGYYLAAYGTGRLRDEREWLSVGAGFNTDGIPFDRVGAFVFEPGNASGTVRLPDAETVSRIVAEVRARGGLIVVNEVTAGMGRTGRWFGFEHYGVRPDIVACGKGLGNGYPISAVALGGDWVESLARTDFRYAQSHQNDPLGCAAAGAVLRTMKRRKLVERAERTGKYFLYMLQNLTARHACLEEARGRGLMCVLQLAPIDGLLQRVHEALFEAGFVTGLNVGAGVLRFYPPLIVEEEMIDALAESLDGILAELAP